MTFTEIIDKFLAEGTHRNLIPVAEVTDLLLDLRQAAPKPPLEEEEPDDGRVPVLSQ